MNNWLFIYKFHFRLDSNKVLKLNVFFPFIGSILGTVIVALTLSIMEGMEYSIFSKLKNVSFPEKIYNITDEEYDAIVSALNLNAISFQRGIEEKILIMKNQIYRLVDLHGIDDFQSFSKKTFNKNIWGNH